jgi:hypothetical protein
MRLVTPLDPLKQINMIVGLCRSLTFVFSCIKVRVSYADYANDIDS